MALTLMALGPYVFYAPVPGENTLGFDTWQRESAFTWPAQQRLSRDPAMQFTGPGADVINIDGRIFPHIFGGTGTLEGMREAARGGAVMTLARFVTEGDGTGPRSFRGYPIGRYVITNLRRNDTRISSNGVAHTIDFTLELTKYGDDSYDGTQFWAPITAVLNSAAR